MKRVITTCYVLETLEPYGNGDIIKICSNRDIAEHYQRLLQPKFKESMDIDLAITEHRFNYIRGELVHLTDNMMVDVCKRNLEEVKQLIKQRDYVLNDFMDILNRMQYYFPEGHGLKDLDHKDEAELQRLSSIARDMLENMNVKIKK